jgi:hypothetical protein
VCRRGYDDKGAPLARPSEEAERLALEGTPPVNHGHAVGQPVEGGRRSMSCVSLAVKITASSHAPSPITQFVPPCRCPDATIFPKARGTPKVL